MIKNLLKHLTEVQESTHEVINNFASTLQALDSRVKITELAAKDIKYLYTYKYLNEQESNPNRRCFSYARS